MKQSFPVRVGEVKTVRTGRAGGRVKNFRTGGTTNLGGGCTFAGGSVPHYMPCLRHTAYNRLLPKSRTSRKKIICNKKVYEN